MMFCRTTAKKKSRRTAAHFPCLIEYAAALRIKAAAFLCSVQDRRPTEGAAMLKYPVFQRHSLLKKAYTQQGAAPANNMNYTM